MRMMRSPLLRFSLLPASLAASLLTPSAGQAVNTYRYDALGRLTVSCSATVTVGQRTIYTYDNADNRSAVSSLITGIYIPTDSSVFSPDGRFQLRVQSDGNMVVYGPSGALWASNTVGSGSNNYAGLQTDGNLVLRTSSGSVVWASNTNNNFCANLSIQNDGNLVIYNIDGTAIWNTNTGGH